MGCGVALKALVKSIIRKAQSAIRRSKLDRTLEHTTRSQVAAELRNLGILSGDAVLVHSSLKSLGFVEGGPKAVISALLDAIGPEGTLVFPAYYQPGGSIYAACRQKNYIFDPRKHGTGVGALPSTFLKLPNVQRSLHPTHSVSALGKHARFITEAHHLAPSIFGVGSPWERLLQIKGKVLGIGVTMAPVAFYHVLEDAYKDDFPLPVRMKKTYNLRCCDASGQIIRVPVVPLDPAYQPRRIDNRTRKDLQDYFMREFSRAGLVTVGTVALARCWFIGARAFYEHLEYLMREGITIYSTADELALRPVA